MPKIAVYKYLVFYIVSYDLTEQLHLHVFSKKHNRNDGAKIWIKPEIKVFYRGALSNEEINLALHLLKKNNHLIKDLIEKFRRGEKIKSLQLKIR